MFAVAFFIREGVFDLIFKNTTLKMREYVYIVRIIKRYCLFVCKRLKIVRALELDANLLLSLNTNLKKIKISFRDCYVCLGFRVSTYMVRSVRIFRGRYEALCCTY